MSYIIVVSESLSSVNCIVGVSVVGVIISCCKGASLRISLTLWS